MNKPVFTTGDVVLVWPPGDAPPFIATFVGYSSHRNGKKFIVLDTPTMEIVADPAYVTEFESLRTSRLPISFSLGIGHTS